MLLTAHRLNLLHPNSLLLTTLHPNPIHPDPLHPPLRSGNGVHDAIDDVGNALWEHSNLIYGSFDYYASIIEGGRDAHGEVDIFALTYNAYTAFVHDGRLVGADACPLSEIDIIWVTVNTPAQSGSGREGDAISGGRMEERTEGFEAKDMANHKRMLTRHEFLQVGASTRTHSPHTMS